MTPKKMAARVRQIKKAEEDPDYYKRITSSSFYKSKRDKRLKDYDPFKDIRY